MSIRRRAGATSRQKAGLATSPYDARLPPRWLPRALGMTAAAVFVSVLVWQALGALTALATSVLVAFFLALVLEPVVLWLVRHGWRRQVAALTSLVAGLGIVLTVLLLFGNLFVQQLVALFETLPSVYADLQDWVATTVGVAALDDDVVVREAFARWGDDVASGAFVVGRSLVSALFTITTILLVAYYLAASGPRFRSSICAWLTPERQGEVLYLWDVTQRKVSDFIASRVVLASLSTVFTFVFLVAVGIPYAIPLAVFTGVVSQFVPTIGTYIAGALPTVVALTVEGPSQAVAVLIFVVAYQQLENFVFSPKVSAHALEMNPAVSFLVVLGAGAVFGPLGAFLGLPVAATVQAVATTYVERYAIIDSQMLHDPAPRSRGESRRRRSGADG